MSENSSPNSGSSLTKAFRRAQQEARVRSSHVGIPTYSPNALPKSGVHPDSSGQVLCPFCAKPYKYSTALLNRQLRCSGCRGTFRVSEDRRSYRIQEAPLGPVVEAGSASKQTRTAIRNANLSLNEAAAAALRAIGKHDNPTPPGSETALRAAVGRSAPPSNNTIRRTSKEAVLTGEGLEIGRKHQRLQYIGAGIILVGLFLFWLTMPDGRTKALDGFQRTLSLASLSQEQRSGVFRGRVAPLTNLADVSFGRIEDVAFSPLGELAATHRILLRGEVWVERSRFGEASALVASISAEPKQRLGQIMAQLKKAGVDARPWSDILRALKEDPSGAGSGIMSKILLQAQPAAGMLDPLALFDAGKPPERIETCTFEGSQGSLLQASGSVLHPVPFRGRLIRFVGAGWPAEWQVYDLQSARP
jgi:hypothetical protein